MRKREKWEIQREIKNKEMVIRDIEKLNNPLTFFDVNVSTSLEVLEDDFWGAPTYPSHLVTTIHKIRTLPLNQLNAGHLRMIIGQKMSLPYMVPLALEKLKEDPLLAGDFYDGDLLQNLFEVPVEFYNWDRASADSLLSLANKAKTILNLKAKEYHFGLDKADTMLVKLIEGFTQKHSQR